MKKILFIGVTLGAMLMTGCSKQPTEPIVTEEPTEIATELPTSTPERATEEPEEEYYIGNKKSKKYHKPSCRTLPAEHNQKRFETRQNAERWGYSACGNCF